jgi:DNA-binding CsgD family transcriptional regulator
MLTTATARPFPYRSRKTRPEREVSDMAHEMLVRIIKGLSGCCSLSVRDQQVLYHFLFGRSPEATGRRLGLRETTVHKHLHRIYARTRTDNRRALLELGHRLAKEQGVPAMRWAPAPAPALAA